MKKTRWTSENKVFKILLGRKSWLCSLNILYILFYHLINYRKVTFGFSTLLLSLILGGRYFRMAKTCTPHGHFKK